MNQPATVSLSTGPRWIALLAMASGAACVLLAFTRPDGGWEWLPAIAGLAVFGTLAGRRITRVPYPNAWPAIVLALVMPGYHIISGINRGWELHVPELPIDRLIQVEPAWMLAYGSVFLFAFLPVFVVRGAELTCRVLWTYIVVELLAFTGFVLYRRHSSVRPSMAPASFRGRFS